MQRPSVRELIDVVLDAGSWQSWDEPVAVPEDDPAYAATLSRARERTGLDEAVVTGEGRIGGRRVAVVLCEFGFVAGSIGVAGGERLTRAIERATRERLPLLASPASGGTRLQEGTAAFLEMIKVTGAVTAHRAAGLPYLVYLRHPTTGGVLASWGSLGHVTVAEPGALIGFLGPRVYEAVYGARFPEGVQVAEHLHAHGLVDAVLPAGALAGVVERVLAVTDGASADPAAQAGDLQPAGTPGRPPPHADAAEMSPTAELPPFTASEAIRRSRRADRPGVRALLDVAASDVTPLSGTGAGEHEPGLVLALARFGDVACMVVGQDRDGQRVQPLGPAGLREAQRGMRLAAELRLPLVTVVDTAGGDLSRRAEEGGLAGEIARCLAEMVDVDVATTCVLLGEGAGGAALALTPADRVVAAQYAWLSPLSPEAASAVLHRSTARADETAEALGLRSVDLQALGLVDRIVPEPDGDPSGFLPAIGGVIAEEVSALLARDGRTRRSDRRARYRALGAVDRPRGG